ncbi:MAG: hypothetical protein C0404_01530 [Verrucomicrobia bacterium]|nr:hypothetical protein [Verrucomicrobiota bacterium]
MGSQKPIDVLKMALSTLVLVSGAVGSAVNLFAGNQLPFVISVTAVVIVVVVIVAEIRSARQAAAHERRIHEIEQANAEKISHAVQDEPVRLVDPARTGLFAAGSSDSRTYLDGQQRVVVRMMRRR